MTDLFGASPLQAQSSLFDLSAIEAGVREVSAIEKSWRLPMLPNEVKLELAQRGQGNVSSFMYGLESDLIDDDEEEEAPVSPGIQPSGLYVPSGRTWQEDASKIWADIRTKPVPTELDVNAPARMKAAMVDKGLLPVGTPLDNSWTQEHQNMKYDLLDKEFDSRIAGDRVGGTSVKNATSMIDDWLSPTGLLQAATELDLWWDPDAIGNEFKTWGDKWRKLAKSNNPFDFAGNLVDALTGPIDDLVIPVLNWGLMATGVGEVAMAAKFAAGAKALSGARAVDNLYNFGKFGKVASTLYRPFRTLDAAADFERMGQASWLAKKLQNTDTFAGLANNLMIPWRQATAVKVAKKWTQTGMKLGVASRVEDLMPGERDGFSLADTPIGEQANEVLGGLRRQPWAQFVTEALVTPYSIFEPGTITKALRGGGEAATAVLSAGSQVVGKTGEGLQAVTAGRAGERLAGLAFKKVTQNQRLVTIFHEGHIGHLATQPEILERYQGLIESEGGVLGALREFYQLSDEQLGAVMSYSMMAAGIDHAAATKVDSMFGTVRDDRWWKEYHKHRSGWVGQLRGTNLDDDDSVIMRVAAKDGGTREEVVQRFKDLKRGHQDMEAWRALGETDNRVARGTLQELLDPEKTGFGPQVLAAYLPQVMATFGDWNGFVRASKELEDLDRTGLLLNMFAKGSRKPLLLETGMDQSDWIFLETAGTVSDTVLAQARTAKASPLTKHVNRGVGKPTVARTDTLTKQDLFAKRRELLKLLELDNHVKQARTVRPLREFMESLTEAGDISTWDAATVRNLVAGDKKRASLVKAMRTFGVNPDQLAQAVSSRLDEAERLTDWRSYGVDDVLRSETGATLTSAAALRRRIKMLGQKANRTATEIDVDAMIRAYDEAGEVGHADRLRQLKSALDESEYKLVFGKEFMAPTDLLSTRPFEDVTQAHIRGSKFNSFFDRRPPKTMMAMRDRYLRASIEGTLARHGRTENLDEIMVDLDRIMDQAVKESTNRIETTMNTGSWGRKRLEALAYQKVPKSIEDLGQGANRKLVVNELTDIYGAETAQLIWDGVKRSKVRTFSEVGLYALEAKIRSSNLADVLHGAAGVKGQAAFGAGVGVLQADKDDSLQQKLLAGGIGGAVGAASGATVGRGIQAGAKAASKAMEGKAWGRYMYLPDALAQLRDYVRFSLNPFLDLQRYSEGWILSQTNKLPEGVSLPMSDSVRSFKKSLGGGKKADETFNGMMESFRTQQKLNGVDADALSNVSRWSTDVGLMGYIPEQKMAVRYAQLQAQGVEADEAYKLARDIYTYGVTGRSAAELSVNFILFPFSYQKKFLGSVGRFLTEDMSRLAMVHDGLKMYHYLDEKVNLNERLEKHMPLLQAMGKFNPFQFGISLGAAGGVNAPFLEPILNGFIPHFFNIKTADDAMEAQDYMKKMLPVWGDINRTWQSALEQQYTVMSPSHQAKRFDEEAGWDKWNDFRSQINELLVTKGMTWADMRRNPALQQMSFLVDQRQAEIGKEHPAWVEARARAVNRSVDKQEELRVRMFQAEEAMLKGETTDDVLLYRFSELDKKVKKVFKTDDSDEEVPPEVAANMQRIAVEYAERDSNFALLYREFFEPAYGPISVRLDY